MGCGWQACWTILWYPVGHCLDHSKCFIKHIKITSDFMIPVDKNLSSKKQNVGMANWQMKQLIYIVKFGVCVCVCQHFNVLLTSPPVLKLWDTQGYLWLPYDLTEVIKLIGETFEPKNIFFQKNTICHSFGIIVIPSLLLSFLPDYCHSFQIIVIPSRLLSFLLD